MKGFHYLLFLLIFISCKNDSGQPVEIVRPPKVLSFSQNIEEAHNKPAFRGHEVVTFHIKLKFGGNTRLDANISMTTNSEKVRVANANGATLVYDGKKLYLSPASANGKNARFDIFTWQYFFSLPFKLTDPGTIWEEKSARKLNGNTYQTARLTFMPGTGDSPEDWYLIYKDPDTNRLKAAAYIVTFNSEPEEAEKNPHIIVYSDYVMVEEVAFASNWKFYKWSEENGIGQQLGEAEISDIHFIEKEKGLFKKPTDSRIID
ncbi:DUF6503 family protein [Christiangramia fulva]|nr:DUF6503 family protein [Christiangramia fulva]